MGGVAADVAPGGEASGQVMFEDRGCERLSSDVEVQLALRDRQRDVHSPLDGFADRGYERRFEGDS